MNIVNQYRTQPAYIGGHHRTPSRVSAMRELLEQDDVVDLARVSPARMVAEAKKRHIAGNCLTGLAVATGLAAAAGIAVGVMTLPVTLAVSAGMLLAALTGSEYRDNAKALEKYAASRAKTMQPSEEGWLLAK